MNFDTDYLIREGKHFAFAVGIAGVVAFATAVQGAQDFDTVFTAGFAVSVGRSVITAATVAASAWWARRKGSE